MAALGAAGSPPPGRADPYLALRLGPYRFYLTARIFFLVGSQMQTAAVGWQLYERLGSKIALGYVGLVQIVPILLLALPAGHMADRLNRLHIVLGGQALFLACSLGLTALSFAHGDPRLIYGLLFMLAVARALITPALSALLPALIPREAWGNAATWSSSTFELASLLGPALAGGIIAATAGATCVYVAAAGCAVLSIALSSRLRPARIEGPRKAASLQDVVGGLRFMFRTKLLLAAASLDLFGVLLGGATTLLPVVAKDILHVGPQGFGWLRSAPSFGAFAMALLTAHRPPWQRAGRALFLAFLGFGCAVIVFGLSRSFWLSLAALAVTGMCDNINVVIRQTLMQFITPDAMRGRVSSINFIFIGCSNELGGFESGLTAQLFGTVPAIVGGGVGTILVVLAVMRLVPGLRRLGRMQDIQPAPA